jgi:hypothetical protein
VIRIDAAGHRDRGPIERDRHAGRAGAVMLRCVSDGVMGAHGEAPDAVDTNGMRIVAADGDSEANVRAADVGHEA